MFIVYVIIIVLSMCIIKLNNKNNIIKSVLIGLLFGIISYNLIPRKSYDLFQHQKLVSFFMNNNSVSYLYNMIHNYELETLPIVYSYCISFFKNINLTQFFVVTLGYSIISYMAIDASGILHLKKMYYIPIIVFSVFGFYAIYFMSGLYFYIGVIFFSFAFYLDYFKKNNKYFAIILYLLSFYTHDTIIFPIFLVIIYKIFKNKISIKLVVLISIIIFFLYNILIYINIRYKIPFLAPIMKMFTAYLNNGDKMKRFYSGAILFIELSKIIITNFFVLLTYNNEKIKKINNYIILLSISTLIFFTKSIVMIRFAMPIQLIGIVPMVFFFKEKRKNIIMYFTVLLFGLFYLCYFIHIMGGQSYTWFL